MKKCISALVVVLLMVSYPDVFSMNAETVKVEAQALPKERGDDASKYPIEGLKIALGEPSLVHEDLADCLRLNLPCGFIVEFYKGTSDFNKIRNKRERLNVTSERMILEYLDGSTWKPIGIPTGIDWLKVSNSTSRIIRTYVDPFDNPILNVVHDVKAGDGVKITAVINPPFAAKYRIVWSVEFSSAPKYKVQKNRIVFEKPDVSGESLYLDWGDVEKTFGDITSANVTRSGRDIKLKICFSVGKLNSDTPLVLDPVIGTVSSWQAIDETRQRKTFYAKNRHWIFLAKDGKLQYYTFPATLGGIASVIGPTVIRTDSGASGTQFMVDVSDDGNYVAYVYATEGSEATTYYRKGLLDTSGGITWLAPEQIAQPRSGEDTSLYTPTIALDSDGYPYIAYVEIYHGEDYEDTCSMITKSSRSDGYWETDTNHGFPTEYGLGGAALVIRLTNRKIYVFWLDWTISLIAGKLYDYDTNTWGSKETIPNWIYGLSHYSATTVGNDIHVAWTHIWYDYEVWNCLIRYRKRTGSSGTWGTIENVRSTFYSESDSICWIRPAISVNNSTECLFVQWLGYPTADAVYMARKKAGQSWEQERKIYELVYNMGSYSGDSGYNHFQLTKTSPNRNGITSCLLTKDTSGQFYLEAWYEAYPEALVLNSKPFFDSGANNFWTAWIAQYPDDPENTIGEGEQSVIYEDQSKWVGISNDTQNWDWSDSIVSQGKKIHTAGYFKSDLIDHPILIYDPDQIPENVLTVDVRWKVPRAPIRRGDPNYLQFRGHNCGSFVAMVHFKIFVHFRNGTETWLDFEADTTQCRMAVCEKFNRWYYDLLTGSYQQANEYNPFFNYYTPFTTHDKDWHSIKAGWMAYCYDAWVYGFWDAGKDFWGLCDTVSAEYDKGWQNLYIIKGQVMTFSVSVETYVTEIEAQCDYSRLMYQG